ncbi:MAG: RNA polymerase sigma factor RpoD/SigA [Bacteroidales bacterium]|nr:RNA polymerase sigma factor RpoD/SigA [Bacteroidales bacterium]
MRQFKNTKKITERNNISVNNYLKEVNRYPMATVDEEVTLAQRIRQGGKEADKARQRLIEANLRFVISVANQYHQPNMDLSDLISEGNIGLIKAAELFDDTRGFKFISYAVWWIRQSISSAICENGRAIRLPLNQQALINKYFILMNKTIQKEQREPTSAEFAEFADISEYKASMLIEQNYKTLSMDAPLSEETDTSVGDLVPSHYRTDDSLDKESLHQDIAAILNHILTAKEREIILRSFGIGCKEEGLEEIGVSLGLSRERVRQIREKALSTIRRSNKIGILTQHIR